MTPPPRPLRLRRPAWLWIALGLLAGPVAGPVPFALALWPLYFGPASALRDGLASLFEAAGLFAAFGLAASLLLGAPWALLTHRRARASRGRVIVETITIAMIFALALSVTWALAGVIREAAASGWASAATFVEDGALFALMILFYAAFVAAWVAPVAGAVLAWVAFTRAPAEESLSRA